MDKEIQVLIPLLIEEMAQAFNRKDYSTFGNLKGAVHYLSEYLRHKANPRGKKAAAKQVPLNEVVNKVVEAQ